MIKDEYTIILIGCDDSTEIDIMLSDEEVKLIKKIGVLSEAISTYGCMPILKIQREGEVDNDKEI